jgi:excisionase family DNA binding protein
MAGSVKNTSQPSVSAQDGNFHAQLQTVLDELRAIRDLLESKRKPTLTVDEVARLVGRDPYTVRTWIKRGRLRAIRVQGTGPRGRLLIERSEFDRLLQAGFAGEIPDTSMA